MTATGNTSQTMGMVSARGLIKAHDDDAKALNRQTKAQLKAIAYHRVIHVYGQPSKDELISMILDARYPRADLNEAIHVLHHQDGLTTSACEWCGVDNRCRFCGQPVRWSTSYDEPHWVHENVADIVRCPQFAGAR